MAERVSPNISTMGDMGEWFTLWNGKAATDKVREFTETNVEREREDIKMKIWGGLTERGALAPTRITLTRDVLDKDIKVKEQVFGFGEEWISGG